MLKNLAKKSLLASAGLCAAAAWSEAAGRHSANAALPTYDFTYSYNGKKYSDLFVGTSPKAGGSSIVVTHIVPVKITVGSFVADPSATDNHGMSPVGYTVASPIFDATTDYKQGKVDVGATQYIDAFNRVNEWGLLARSKQAGWHVLLQPKVESGLSFTNPSGATVETDFGIKAVNYSISAFDAAIQSTIKLFPTSDLVVFMTTQTYLTSGGCCIGGYHSYTGSQSYAMFSYITNPTLIFGWDVSSLSLELGSWLDDPHGGNSSPCGSYAVGDPPETGLKNHPYALWTYTLNGVAYHVRDMATPVYFGAPPHTAANGFYTFQGFKGLSVCQGAP